MPQALQSYIRLYLASPLHRPTLIAHSPASATTLRLTHLNHEGKQ